MDETLRKLEREVRAGAKPLALYLTYCLRAGQFAAELTPQGITLYNLQCAGKTIHVNWDTTPFDGGVARHAESQLAAVLVTGGEIPDLRLYYATIRAILTNQTSLFAPVLNELLKWLREDFEMFPIIGSVIAYGKTDTVIHRFGTPHAYSIQGLKLPRTLTRITMLPPKVIDALFGTSDQQELFETFMFFFRDDYWFRPQREERVCPVQFGKFHGKDGRITQLMSDCSSSSSIVRRVRYL
ncbi:hypothetical protein HY489_01070 [Candidatus Woesearchaeota archaeon]|nr:hypothetical protein [Candidatus Woesearchaeota archaeon]